MDEDGFSLVLKGRKNKLYKDTNKPLNNKQLPNKNDNVKNKQLRDNHLAKQQSLLNSNKNIANNNNISNNNKKKELYVVKSDEELFQQLLSNVNKFIETMITTQFFKDIVENEILSTLLNNIGEIVCYGIGSCQSSKKCQEQFAFIIALKNYFKLNEINIYIFDPVMSDSDNRLVEQFGIKMITVNEEAKRKITLPSSSNKYTLFYMPFCPRKLYDNVLWANFSIESLPKLIVLGNSFNRYNEMHLPPDQSYLPYCYTKKLYTHYQELELPNNYPTKFIFHDLSFHYFKDQHLQTLTESFWLDSSEPPKIIDDPEVH